MTPIPADQRVASDYGGALSRLAAAFPDDQLPANIGIVRESVRVLREIARVNPQNLLNRSDLAYSYGQLGDALRLSGDRAGAVRAYQEGLSLLEPLLNNTQRQPAIVFLEISQKTGGGCGRPGRARAGARVCPARVGSGRSRGALRQGAARGDATVPYAARSCRDGIHLRGLGTAKRRRG